MHPRQSKGLSRSRPSSTSSRSNGPGMVRHIRRAQTVTVEEERAGGAERVLGPFKHLLPSLDCEIQLHADAVFRPTWDSASIDHHWGPPISPCRRRPAIPLISGPSSVGVAGQAGFDFKVADNGRERRPSNGPNSVPTSKGRRYTV